MNSLAQSIARHIQNDGGWRRKRSKERKKKNLSIDVDVNENEMKMVKCGSINAVYCFVNAQELYLRRSIIIIIENYEMNINLEIIIIIIIIV